MTIALMKLGILQALFAGAFCVSANEVVLEMRWQNPWRTTPPQLRLDGQAVLGVSVWQANEKTITGCVAPVRGICAIAEAVAWPPSKTVRFLGAVLG